VDFGLQNGQNPCCYPNRGVVIVYYARHRAGTGFVRLASEDYYIPVYNIFLFF